MKSIDDLTVNIINNKIAFAKLKEDWDQLAYESNQPVFMSHSWVMNWWDVFGDNPNRKLFIHAVYADNIVVAIFPFYTGRSSILGKETEKRIQLLGSGGNRNETFGYTDFYGISDFLDLMVKPGYENHLADFFIRMLEEDELSGYQFHFINISEGSFIHTYLIPLFEKGNRSLKIKKTDRCPYIELSVEKDLAEFIKDKNSGSVRRRFRQCLKAQKPETENGYQIEEVTSREGVEDAIKRIIELHQSRWNALGYTGVFFDKRFKDFFKRIVLDAFENKSLWLKHAIDKDGICASRMLLRYNDRYYDYISGFSDNAASAKYRPGIALLLDVIEDALKAGISRVELLRGEESYKYDFTDKTFFNFNVDLGEHPKAKNTIKSLKSATRMLSLLYKHTSKEIHLMQVQNINHGLLRMPISYVKFRVNRLKDKVKESR